LKKSNPDTPLIIRNREAIVPKIVVRGPKGKENFIEAVDSTVQEIEEFFLENLIEQDE